MGFNNTKITEGGYVMKKKLMALVLTAAMAAAVLAGCASTGAAPAASSGAEAAPAAEAASGEAEAVDNSGRTLNIGIGSEISQIVPMSNNVAVANRDGLIVFALYDPLIWYNTETNELSPWIATEWSHNEDATEWYFTIRDDVVFHNGEKMTA